MRGVEGYRVFELGWQSGATGGAVLSEAKGGAGERNLRGKQSSDNDCNAQIVNFAKSSIWLPIYHDFVAAQPIKAVVSYGCEDLRLTYLQNAGACCCLPQRQPRQWQSFDLCNEQILKN